MKIFDLDSPLMRTLSRIADLLLLNLLAGICCIPIITVGASMTALHYMSLKLVRHEECYIIRGFFKSFKENFRQATLIWLIFLAAIIVLACDFYIMKYATISFPVVLKVVIMIVAIIVAFTGTFVFATLAKFDNPVFRTIKNAFVISILQFPKTIAMIILSVLPLVLAVLFIRIVPLCFLFGLSAPAYVFAMMYNKFFKKLETQIEAANGPAAVQEPEGEDERIFRDEVDESISINENQH